LNTGRHIFNVNNRPSSILPPNIYHLVYIYGRAFGRDYTQDMSCAGISRLHVGPSCTIATNRTNNFYLLKLFFKNPRRGLFGPTSDPDFTRKSHRYAVLAVTSRIAMALFGLTNAPETRVSYKYSSLLRLRSKSSKKDVWPPLSAPMT